MAQADGRARLQLGRGKTVEQDGIVTVTTNKTVVRLQGEQVVKRYSAPRSGRRRCRLERRALERMHGIDGIPRLLHAEADGLGLRLARIDGTPVGAGMRVPDSAWTELRRIIEEGLARGVARHSMPVRDLLLRPDGRMGVVDFERVTLRWWRYGPIWLIACFIARYHLARRIAEFAPHLLTAAERRRMRWQVAGRNLFTRIRRAVKGH